MHRPARSRRQRRPRPRSLRARTLKDRTTALRNSRSVRRGRIRGSRTRLRHNHPAYRCSRSGRRSGRRSFRRSRRSLRSRRSRRRRSHRSRNGSSRNFSRRNRCCGRRSSCRLRRNHHRRRSHYRPLLRTVRCRSMRRWSRWSMCSWRMSCRSMRSRSPHRRTRNHRTGRGLARNRGSSTRRRHNVGALPRQRHNLSRTRWGSRRLWRRSARRSSYTRNRRWFRCNWSRRMARWRSNHRRPWSHWRSGLRRSLSLLAFQDRLQRIARLRHLRQVKLRFALCSRLRRGTPTTSAAQKGADLLRLVGLDRAGVSLLLGDADGHQSVQNGLALHFQFPCQIVDSNFAHPSLFCFPGALAAHTCLFDVGIVIGIIPETVASAIARLPLTASHGRVHRQCLRLRPPGPRPPACQPCRWSVRCAPREHPHR